jgi:hypothetical protein
MNNSVPPETPGEKLANMTDGRDDPNRGPLDRAENVIEGRDDPNRGPVDRTQNALGGDSAFFEEERERDGTLTSNRSAGVISAVFDSDDEARDAVSDLRREGVGDSSLSLITQRRGTTTTSGVDGEVVDEEHTNLLRGILGGGALGAGLGVAALAIPAVGPLVAAGAIATSAVPSAMAIGAGAGAVLGTINEVLKSHGVSDEDAAYYGERMKSGCVLVTVNPSDSNVRRERIEEILYANGGHNSARARVM